MLYIWNLLILYVNYTSTKKIRREFENMPFGLYLDIRD